MEKESRIASIKDKIDSEKNRLSPKIIPSSKSGRVSKAVAKHQEKYGYLLEMENQVKEAMEMLSASLEAQRRIADKNPMIQVISEPGNQRWKISRRYNYLQEIFCLAKDYREPKDGILNIEDENQLMKSMIIHAEFISDELLLELWLEDEGFLKLEYPEQLKRKLQHIDEIKWFFSETLPLQIGNWANDYTWRIMTAKKAKNPSYWKIILIQSVESWDETSRKQRKTLTFHDDIYTFQRSQKHTISSLNSKEKSLGKVLASLRKLRFQIGSKTFLESVSKNIEALDSYKSYHLKISASHLKKIKWADLKSDKENLEWAISRIDMKLKEIISQKSSIYKHSENIWETIRNFEEDWKNFYKNFKNILKKFNNAKIDDIVEAFWRLDADFKKSFPERISSILNDTNDAISIINLVDYDEEAKVMAYLWALEDSAHGRATDSREYQEHQYFEAMKQKKVYFWAMKSEKLKELDFIKESWTSFKEFEDNGNFNMLLSIIDTYLKSRPEFCINPFARIYERVWSEYFKIGIFKTKKDMIWIIKSILTINLLLKEQWFLIFMSKLEWNLDASKMERSDYSRDIIWWRINKNLGEMTKKDFLAKYNFPKDSTVNKRFEDHIRILLRLKKLFAQKEYGEMEIIVTGARRWFYLK
ncbi:MAG: hypothetical protein ACD_2C00018G0005 [uncultured bacterium (gcode 4)]|uniref:Uncharacterized protein n=1 Tax=uncultured bacterium (gcode 4) TaxID=1234023 RepID=K2G7B1_9BACT|nr:MAG: hypothetical protein ACD_2C00018G0005 [uncultured bacterium (gcode 4)]